MDREGYRQYLIDRVQPIPEEEIIETTKMVEKFEEYLKHFGKTLETASATEVNNFTKVLIEEKLNTYTSLVALSRYGNFIKNMDFYLAVLELIDGAEVMNVLNERLGEHIGETKRDEILPKEDLPPLGLPSSQKIDVTRQVLEKMNKVLTPEECKKVLADVAHGLPRDFRKGEREKFLKAGSIDEYLRRQREEGIAELEKHRDNGTLFFNQYITDDVVNFVKGRPDVLVGERRENTIYHTKIPYMTQEYLDATDERMKRYYACHCAWARESILKGEEVSAEFCYCSGGFTKQPWEAALNQPLEVELMKSVLRGDDECSFIIHLPDNVP
ncbi:hypothetical protein EU527_11600 [Candidatus Thorarchaeota archaeon]|nr:MAG: hypothetical protein EU527_11600 [Candidatus Thorarchaeota archaeon]